MANPQVEDGHVDIANEIVEYLARYRLSGQEWQVLWVILRKTWGWHKKKDKLSLGYIAKKTLIKRPAVARAINKLVTKGVIKKDNSYINMYMFNKDYETWRSVIKRDTSMLSKDENNNTETVKIREKLSDNFTGRECIICGFKEKIIDSDKAGKVNEFLLHQHHIEFIMNKNGLPKSNKNSDVISVCYGCHRKIHDGVINNDTILRCYQKRYLDVIKKDNKSVTNIDTTTKETTKETITKENIKDTLRFQVIEYLNKITHSKYKPNTPVTVKHINARLKEGFLLEDFRHVIDVKWAEWGGKFTKEGKSCEDWMRPITLFGPKFEGYLNQEKPDSFEKYLKKE